MSHLHNNPHLELPPPQQQRGPPGSPQQQQQQQYQIASMYPKIPSQDEPPTYSPSYPSTSQQQPPPQYQPHPMYQQIQQMPIPNTQFYGSMPAPSVTSPAPPSNQQQHVIQPLDSLKTKTKLVQCPHCQQLVYTVLDYDAGVCTALSIGGLFLAGCNNGLCLLPWLFPWTKDVTHECPSCKQKIAKFTRLERDTRMLALPAGL